MPEKKSQYIGIDAARSKIRQFCSYQERAHSEVREKLAEFGMFGEQAEVLTAELLQDNYLNEERFAKAFAGGKFRMKKWGKDKIAFELKKKGVSAACIKIGMKEIDLDEYERIFRSLAEAKWENLRSERNHFTKKRKLTDFLRGKGYEFSMIADFIKEAGEPRAGKQIRN